MTNANFLKQGFLERSRERLNQAVARLEAALENQGRNLGESDAALAYTLSVAEAEKAKLEALNRAVSGRLESAIGRLKKILEG